MALKHFKNHWFFMTKFSESISHEKHCQHVVLGIFYATLGVVCLKAPNSKCFEIAINLDLAKSLNIMVSEND
jgi:hypothetical protein